MTILGRISLAGFIAWLCLSMAALVVLLGNHISFSESLRCVISFGFGSVVSLQGMGLLVLRCLLIGASLSLGLCILSLLIRLILLIIHLLHALISSVQVRMQD